MSACGIAFAIAYAIDTRLIVAACAQFPYACSTTGMRAPLSSHVPRRADRRLRA